VPETILTFPPNPAVTGARTGGEATLEFPEVNLIFWGRSWSANPPPSPSAHVITSAIRAIVNSGYLAELAQYGVIGQPKVVATDVADESDPSPANFVSRLADFIISRIEAGKVLAPSADHRSFYGVIVPAGLKSKEHPNAAGAHSSFAYRGFTAQMAWILNDGHLTSRFSAVHVFSHEFVEACAGGADVSVTTVSGGSHEIADVCDFDDDTSNGFSLHAYYSDRHRLCVLPLTRPIVAVGARVAAVSRGPDSLALAAVGLGPAFEPTAIAYSAALDRAQHKGRWRGWWTINDATTVLTGAISMVTRQPDLLDAFVVGADGKVRTAAWDAARDVFSGGWRGWWPVGDQSAPAGAPIGAAATGPERLDIAVAGNGGHVAWAFWDQGIGNDWQSWRRVGDLVLPPGGNVEAVARSAGRLDLFAVGQDGKIVAASHLDSWTDWRAIPGVTMDPGAPVTAVSRDGQSLDAFVVPADGGVRTATLGHADTGEWSTWRRIGTLVVKPASRVAVVAQDAHTLDAFVVGIEGGVWTARWTGSDWGAWTRIPLGVAAKPNAVTAVSRAPGVLDVIFVGEDSGIRTATWERHVAGGAWQAPRTVPD
jgi:hypothetical protein